MNGAPEDPRIEDGVDLSKEKRWRALLDRVRDKTGAPVPTRLTIVEGRELSLRREGSILARLRGDGMTHVVVGKTSFDALDERGFEARLAQAALAANGSGAVGLASRFGDLLEETRETTEASGTSGWFSPAYWIVRLVGFTASTFTDAARELRQLAGDHAAAKAYGSKRLVTALEATRDAKKERRKYVEGVGAKTEGDGGAESLWELFGSERKARKKHLELSAEESVLPDGCTWHTPPKLLEVIDAERRAAQKTGVAFFDTFTAMGGMDVIGGMIAQDPPLAYQDHVHFTGKGYALWADLLLEDLMRGYAAWEKRTVSTR